MVVFSALLFFAGLFFGSFLNVLVDRLPSNESPFTGRSHCEKCNHVLAWYDLAPLFSFLSLKGKCRYCHVSLSYYYPVIELSTGILFLGTLFYLYSASLSQNLFNFQLSIINLSFYLFVVSCFIVIFFADLKYGIIPDKIVLPAIVISFLYLILANKEALLQNSLAGVVAFLFFLFLAVITRGKGMGGGDVKLVLLMGLVLGLSQTFVAIYLAFLTGALVSLFLIAIRKKHFRKSTIPFGPFLVLGALIAPLVSNTVLKVLGLS